MPRLKTFAVLLLIALVLLLPLYEFVDIGEHWPYDGNVVLVVLSASIWWVLALSVGVWRVSVWHCAVRGCVVCIASTRILPHDSHHTPTLRCF